MTVHCKACNHEWEFQIKLPVSVTRFVKAARGLCIAGCPACGADDKNVLCGPAPNTRVAPTVERVE